MTMLFTFKKHDLVVARPLVHSVHAVQIGRQALPEAMDLSRAKGHQVLLSRQPPKVLPWDRQEPVRAWSFSTTSFSSRLQG